MANLSDREVVEVPLDKPETEDRAVALELTDSLDCFRLNVISDGRLCGKAGAVADGVRAGNLGPKEF